jgi:hypothetical protein
LWKHLLDLSWRIWRWSQRGRDARRVTEARARFWAEVHAGEREADAFARDFRD